LSIISGGKSGLMNTHSPGQFKTKNSYRVTEVQTRFSLIDSPLQKAVGIIVGNGRPKFNSQCNIPQTEMDRIVFWNIQLGVAGVKISRPLNFERGGKLK
jgi:hypothetical protein